MDEAKTRVALYLALTMAPLAVAAPFLARLLAHAGFRRAVTLVVASGRCVAAAVMAGRTDSLLLFPLAFLVLVQSRVHLVSKNALTASYAGRGDALVSANALLSRVAAVSAALAAVPGVVAARFGGAGVAIALAAVAYGVCALLTFRLPAPAERPTAGTTEPREIPGSLNAPAVGMAGVRAGGGFLLFLIAFTVRRVERPSYWLGALVAAVALGTFLGAVVAPRLARRGRESRVVLAALAVTALGAVAAARNFALLTLAGFALLAGLAAEVARLAFQSLLQREVAEGEGRAFVRFEVVFHLAWVAGAFVPAMVPVTFRQGLLAMAALSVGVAAAQAFSARRGRAA